MADDTLSQVSYTSPIVKTRLAGQERYALSRILVDSGGTKAGLVRIMLEDALAQCGWPLAKRIDEYANYRVECLANGTANEFEEE